MRRVGRTVWDGETGELVGAVGGYDSTGERSWILQTREEPDGRNVVN